MDKGFSNDLKNQKDFRFFLFCSNPFGLTLTFSEVFMILANSLLKAFCLILTRNTFNLKVKKFTFSHSFLAKAR